MQGGTHGRDSHREQLLGDGLLFGRQRLQHGVPVGVARAQAALAPSAVALRIRFDPSRRALSALVGRPAVRPGPLRPGRWMGGAAGPGRQSDRSAQHLLVGPRAPSGAGGQDARAGRDGPGVRSCVMGRVAGTRGPGRGPRPLPLVREASGPPGAARQAAAVSGAPTSAAAVRAVKPGTARPARELSCYRWRRGALGQRERGAAAGARIRDTPASGVGRTRLPRGK